jgi:N-methylhydantoinase B
LRGDSRLAAGDLLSIQTPGGSGLEPPELRDPAAVAADVRGEYISEARAREVYGVVLAEGGQVDSLATERLRHGRAGTERA